jgi:TatA/E family protein of Tat protein translocase
VSIGPAEIIIVLVIALLVFGPKRLPDMGKSLGKGVREFRKAAETAKTELGLDGVTDQINEVKSTFTEPLMGITGAVDDLKSSVDLKSAIEAPVAATAVAGAVDEEPETPAITPQTAFADVPQAAPAEPEQPEAAPQMGFGDVPQAPEQPEATEAPAAPEPPDRAVAAGSPASPSAGD